MGEIERLRERFVAASEGYRVHHECGGEVIYTGDKGDACAKCGAAAPTLPAWTPESLDRVADVGYLLQELDRARAEPRRANVEIEHLERVIENVERDRDEARERVRALEKQAALDLDAMRDALATMKQQRELVDRLYAEAKGWHDQVAIDKETLRRVEEWAAGGVGVNPDTSVPMLGHESAARQVLLILRGARP